MLDSLNKPVVFAHRGASKYAPENTITAFKLAIEQQADAIELDVQLSADKVIVVFHDNKLDRTTNGKGFLKDHDYQSLLDLSAGKLFGPPYQSEKIPTLFQVFETFGKSIYYNIELKNLLTPFDSLPARVTSIIQEFNLEDHVLISSFNPIALLRLERSNSYLPKGILIKGRFPITLQKMLFFTLQNYQSVHFSFDSISANQVQSIHSSGKLAFTYTLNLPADILTSLRFGLDGFFTDDPALARKTILSMEDK